MLVLVDQITPRVEYTFDFIFKQRKIDYSLTTSVKEFEEFNDFRRLNYSSHILDGVKQIVPTLLLRQSSLIPVKVEKTRMLDQDCLRLDDVDDIVASVFYVLSRYEEYFCNEFDEYKRFPFAQSILKEYNWIEQAVCDRWSKAIIEFVNADLYIDSALEISLNTLGFKTIPTFDIDNAYAYKFKSGKRRFLSASKDLLNFNLARLKERKSVEQGKADPYDTYDKIKEVAQQFADTKVFWLTESNGAKDRNLDIDHPEHQRLIKSISEVAEIGLHPSFGSFGNQRQIQSEKLKLEEIIEQEIGDSRQHFLRFQLPKSFEILADEGFKHEYSMGFAEHVGFRAGTGRAHLWFDLKLNVVSNLTIHPFVYMDGTLNEYMNLTIQESKVKIDELREELKTFGGDFVFIWHNETIGNYGKWKGWSKVLDYTLNSK